MSVHPLPPPPRNPKIESLHQAINRLSHEQEATKEQVRKLADHMLEVRYLLNVATFPMRVPLWFLAGAVSTLVVVEMVRVFWK